MAGRARTKTAKATPGRTDANAEKARQEILNRHREEWEEHRRFLREAVAQNDPERAKLCKVLAEAIRIRQEAERRCHGIADPQAEAGQPGSITVRWLDEDEDAPA